MRKRKRDSYAVYGLIKADAEPIYKNVRYVGKGPFPSRPQQHGVNSHLEKYGHYPIVRWIKKLRASGGDYSWFILEKTTPELANEREVFWIAKFRKEGLDLLNCTDGGEG